MAATVNSDNEYSKGFESLDDDAVVITGISGVFPSSESVLEFKDNLYNKVDMITDEPQWEINDLNLPKHLGRVKGMNKFDAQFFKVSYQLARVLEPMSKKLLENAYGAIFDSGTNLTSLKGKNVGVFVGASYTDFSLLLMFDINKKSNFVINGGSKSMMANRISYWIDGKGPSFNLDYACASSTACLEKAYQSIKAGDCDAALVGGCNNCINPVICMNMKRAGLLCMDGKTKCFDKNGDGYVRSDAVGMIFLQKAKNAKRIYAEIYHAKGLYKMRPDAAFLPVRESEDIQKFLQDFYSETDVDPDCIEYVEAHASGIAEADCKEIDAISKIFAKSKPIKVGSVKSNMGHSDSASGICSLTKICLAYHEGKLPANLHYSEPIETISDILQEKVHVLTEETPFQRGFTAINDFSYTGANYHILLKGHSKENNLKKYESEIPRLVLASGRQEESVAKIFDLLENQPINHEQLALLQNVFEYDILGHTGRGYEILDTNEKNEVVCLSKSIDYYQGDKRQLWFVFSGMGSQWAGMGIDLLKVPTFAKAIDRCKKVLEPMGIDIMKILTEKDDRMFDKVDNGFLGIGAVQIGLIDIMKELGIVPDFIIGHSLGEMACAYQDETFTAEEFILASWCRGKVCNDIPVVKGAMAAVGISYKDIINKCPPEIDVACHNSSESTTISGPVKAVTEFIKDLTKRGVFAKEVQCGNIAYHSRYISVIGQKLKRDLEEIIKCPKARSSKWLSTSVPQDKWNEELAKYSSAEYHANNMLSPVLFEEACALIPDNAIIVEIAPHGLLQAILKRSLKNCTHIPLTKRGTPDGIKFLLEAIGKMYQAGLNPKIDILYPKIEYPVSTSTPLLSHFVNWVHTEEWPQLVTHGVRDQRRSIARHVIMSIHDDDYKYLRGHLRNGTNILSEAAILVLVWETLAMYRNMDYRYLSVIFRDIHFHSEVNIQDDKPLKLYITINRGNDRFEVTYDETQIASGVISGVRSVKFNHELHDTEENEDEIRLTSEDIYSILQNRGIMYKDQFKSIQSSNLACDDAKVQWTKEWVTFLDSLIQLNILAREYDGVSVPKFIQKLAINVLEQDKAKVEYLEGVACFHAQNANMYKTIRCAGAEIENITFVDKSALEMEPGVLETSKFFSYYTMNNIDMTTALHVILQIVHENATTDNIKLTEVVTSSISKISTVMKDVLDNSQLNINLESVEIDKNGIGDLIRGEQEISKANVFVFHNLLHDDTILNNLQNIISNDTFLLSYEESIPNIHANKKECFTIITSMSDGKQILVLLKKANKKQDVTYIKVDYGNTFTWVPRVYAELEKTKRVILVSEKQPYCGLKGIVHKIRRTISKKVSAVIIEDFYAPKFNPECDFYSEQLEKNLAINIFKKGQWGNYCYIPSCKTINTKNITLASSTPGNFEKLAWVEAPPTQSNDLLVQVCYAGISMRDIENAVKGVNEGNQSFGMDFSGIDYSGERVMGVISGGALSGSVKADPELLWPVPEHWSLEDAATVPLPYLHAYYCLTQKVNVRKGQSVFVTGGAGAFGQAVITLCLSLDCTVFTSVSNVEKKNFLMRLFPRLNENNIDYSGRDDFHYMVLTQTDGERCDIVINCASGSHREAAMKCVRPFGVFIDVNKHDMNENKYLGMNFLAEDKHYQAADINNVFILISENDKKELYLMISEGISKGIVTPLSRVIYSIVNVPKAFRLMSTDKHRGRVIIRMRDPTITSQGVIVLPRMTFSSQGVYIIACDGTGRSVDLADRLVKRGEARKIMINLQNSHVSGYMQYKFALWQKRNVIIKLSLEKLYTDKGCATMFREAKKMGEISGIFILLKTKAKVNDEIQNEFVETFNKTVMAVSYIDRESRKLSNGVSHFVVLARRSNCDSDEYAVSVIENICDERNNVGLPALILHYENLYKEEINIKEHSEKSAPLTLSTLFESMDRCLKLKYKNVYTFNLKKEMESNIIKSISDIIGVKSIGQLKEDTLISDFNLNEINLNEIRTIIKYNYKIDYPIEKIKNISIKSLMELNKKEALKNRRVDVVGLETLYTSVGNEEDHLTLSNTIIHMPTLLNNCDEDFNPEDTYLTVIPGFDGQHEAFTSITERLKIKAVGVHLGPDMSNESIPKLAADVRQLMKTKLITKSKFYLMGYSFGINVALELAAILEKEGHVGVVYCIDSSPDFLKKKLETYLNSFTLNQLQNNIAEHICYLLSGKKSEKLHDDLKDIETWSEKVECCLKNIRNTTNYSIQYKRLLFETAYRRIIMARCYEPDVKLESELVLIKATAQPKAEDLPDDYNLLKYTNHPVKVFDVESDHISIINDCRIANIINRLLDPHIQMEFKNQNLCDTYYVHSE